MKKFFKNHTLEIIVTIIAIMVSVFWAPAQNKATLNVAQDIRLAISGDDHGNDYGTLNLVIKSEWQTRQRESGYIFAYPQFEFADLYGGKYYRYCLGSGYTFNKFSESLDISPSANWGMIHRWGYSWYSWEFQVDTSVKISKHFRLGLLLSETQRKDIDNWTFNSYLGVKYLFR